MGIAVFGLMQSGIWTLHFSINVGITFAASSFVFVIVSRMTPAPDDTALDGLVYDRALVAPDRPMPWYQDYRYQSAGLVACMLAILVFFW